MDAFELLRQPRRPWLDPESLKVDFLKLAAQAHPDKSGAVTPEEKTAANQRCAELNAGYQILAEPRDRARLLYELETGGPLADSNDIPAAMMNWFMELGSACRRADKSLAAKAQATSPLLKARAFGEGLAPSAELDALQARLEVARDEVVESLKPLNPVWDAAPPIGSPARAAALPLKDLEAACRKLVYFGRWLEQVRSRLTQLSM